MSGIQDQLSDQAKQSTQILRSAWINSLSPKDIKKDANCLRITGCKSNNWALALNQLSSLTDITKLSIIMCNISADITGELSQMRQLRSLILPRYRLTRERICNLSKLFNLTQIVLNDCQITDDSVSVIATYLNKLVRLDLSVNSITDVGAIAIGRSRAPLNDLALHQNQITSKGCSAIVRKHRQLKELRIGYNQIGDEGVAEITRCLTKLTLLSIVNNKVTCEGVLYICKNSPGLRTLHIDSNQIRIRGAVTIACRLPKLQNLRLVKNFVPPLGIWQIKYMHKTCEIDDRR